MADCSRIRISGPNGRRFQTIDGAPFKVATESEGQLPDWTNTLTIAFRIGSIRNICAPHDCKTYDGDLGRFNYAPEVFWEIRSTLGPWHGKLQTRNSAKWIIHCRSELRAIIEA